MRCFTIRDKTITPCWWMLVCYPYETHYYSNIRKQFTITKIHKTVKAKKKKKLCFHRILQWCHLSGSSSMTFIARSWILKEIFMQLEKLSPMIWRNMTNGGRKKKSFHACINLSAPLKTQNKFRSGFESKSNRQQSGSCICHGNRKLIGGWIWGLIGNAWLTARTREIPNSKISPVRLPWLPRL